MTSRTINRAIKHTGLIINKGSGYQYFTDAVTNEQIGESVEEAEYARQNDHGCPRLSSML
jgi:hypothetical protein